MSPYCKGKGLVLKLHKCHHRWECKLCSYCGKQYEGFSKIKNRATIGLSNSTPGIYPKKLPLIQKVICTSVFIAALFTIAKIQKQPKYLSTEEWIQKMWYTHIHTHNRIFSSVQFSRSVVSDSLWPHESRHARPPCPSPTPGVYSNSCPSRCWYHPAISSSVVPFSSCPQSLPASGSFPMSQLFAWGGQSIGVSASASVRPMNT